MDITLLVFSVLTGFCAMLSGGFWGLGGGWLIMPALLLAGVNLETAITASLLQMVPSTLPTVIRQFPQIGWSKGSWGMVIAVPICLFSFIGSLFGKPLGDLMFRYFQSSKPQEALYLVIMGLILFQTLKNARKEGNSPSNINPAEIHLSKVQQFTAAIAGVLTGLISSLLGIGGGSMVRPVMKSLLKVPEKMAGMILRFSVLIVAISGSASYLIGGTHFLKDSMALALALTIGGMPGFTLGAKMHSIVLKAGFHKFTESSFALFVLFIIASIICKLTNYIMTGRVVIVIAGIVIIVFISTVTHIARKKLPLPKTR